MTDDVSLCLREEGLHDEPHRPKPAVAPRSRPGDVAFLVGMTLSGLSLWLLPFSVGNQILVLVHTLAGMLLVLPVSYYLLSHWLLYRRHQMTHVKLLGYAGVLVFALCNVSGLVLTFQALMGPRIGCLWDTVHIVTTFGILAFVAPHVLALVIRDRKARLPGMAAHGKGVALATVAALVAFAFLVYAYVPPRLSEEFPPDYSYAFRPDRPFAPSLAVTATGKAYDSRLLAGSEGCGTTGCHQYDYERLLPRAPWNAASGRYTRYGDVVSLISEADDYLVVMAPGDETTLVFDPSSLPPPADGEKRDYFLHFRGWAKDQDPNTWSSRTVEPLPAMAKDGADPLRTRMTPALVPPLSLPKTSEEQETPSLRDAVTKGTPSLAFRFRYEGVDEGAFEKDAHAPTLRTALGYRTLPYHGLSFFLQAQNVVALGDDAFDNRGAGHLANGVSDRPAVTDPSQTRMQQVYGRLEAFDTTFDVGRREIAYGDHRFVGDVNWRQNHQAFDAFHLSNRSLARTTLSYTFADRVIRVDGGDKDMSSHFLNAAIALRPEISLELYSYLLDYDEETDAPLSSQSYGGKLSGSHPFLEKHRLLFEAQYAKQTDFGANPAERNADYFHLVGGVGLSERITLKLGRELLGGSPEGGAFQTPLATLFKFNGWADKFLTTPPGGLIDWYVSGEGRLRAFAWTLAYHDFRADAGSDRYGAELDARAVFSTAWKQSLGFQVALYRADRFAADTSKVWLWTEYGF